MFGSRLQPASSATSASAKIGTTWVQSDSARFIGILQGPSVLLRDIATQLRSHLANKLQKSLPCALHALAVSERRCDSNEGTVAAVVTDGVGDLVILGPVFVGLRTIVRLVPVEHQPALRILGDQVFVGSKRRDA